METRKPWRYQAGDVIHGRTIKRRLLNAKRSGHRVYLIGFPCCDREAEMLEVSLESAERSEPFDHIAYCPTHRRKRKRNTVELPPPAPPLFATFPLPGPIAKSLRIY